MKYVLFKLDEEIFAADVRQVLSIERIEKIKRIPHTPGFIRGIMDIRGETTAIIDLKERIEKPASEDTDETRILVVVTDDVQLGFVIDAAIEVKDLSEDLIEEPPKIIAGVRNAFLQGVTRIDNQLILILNLEKVLDFEETNQIKEVIEESE